MKYGYFDDKNREYVIERPDTPAPWVNYLGSPEYGAIISNNAGGYSFAKSGANGRILGMYSIISISRDDTSISGITSQRITGLLLAAVGKDLDRYDSQCRHGLGYTKMTASYAGIRFRSSLLCSSWKNL